METSQPTEDFKKIIIDSLAFNIFHNENAFREETDGKHISINLFEDPLHLREITLRLLRTYINHTNSKIRSGTFGRGIWETSLFNNTDTTSPIANCNNITVRKAQSQTQF